MVILHDKKLILCKIFKTNWRQRLKMKPVLRSFKEVFNLPDDWQIEMESVDTISQWLPYRQKTEMRVGRVSPLAFSLMLALGTANIADPAHASNIQADKSAPHNQQPIVAQTANGLPQVNIQTPTSAGVSVNQYQQFDVNSKGAILNNSRRNTQTQLGGWIQGNPFLATGEARIIVNQVNSANPSLLNGYVEVGGKRAEVILANPAGIQVNGGGFINAQSATLTTGQTLIGSGQLDRYAVHDGKISIKGKGLDAKDTDFTRILSRYVEVDAPIAANDLTVIAGQNTVSADGKIQAATKNTPKQKTVAIDSSELGGMYANKITLISTENNQRIDNKGQIFAQAGGVALDSQGYLTNAGTISSQGKTEIKAGDVRNSGTISSKDKFDFKAENLDNSGTVLAANEWNARLSGSLNNQGGDIAANHALNIHDNQAKTLRIDNTDGKIVAKDVSLQSQSLDNRGKLAAGNNLSIDLKDDFSVERNLEAGNKLSIKTAGSLNNAQTIQAESEVNIRSKQDISNRGLMSSNGLTRVEAGQELLNIGTGKIYGDHVALVADSVVNRDENGKAPVVAARERLDIGARKLENQEAAVLSSEGDLGIGGSLNAEHKATGLADSLINGSARIEAQGNGSIAVRDLRNLNNHFKTEEYLD